MSKPSLLYFNGAGRVFGLRVALFKAFGKDGWEDSRIEFHEWAALKPDQPLGSLPVLTLPDGRKIVQTDAIMRWAGKQSGLYPNDPLDALLVDETISTVFETLSKVPPAGGPDGKAKREEYAAGLMTKACTMLESKLMGDWFVGSAISLADLAVSVMVNMIVTDDWTHVAPSWMDSFPKLKALNLRVREDPLVVDYLAQYPN